MFALFASLLGGEVAYVRALGLRGDQELPYAIIAVPLIWVFAVSSLAFLSYISPKKAARQIQSMHAHSTLEILSQNPNLVIQRADIDAVSIQGYSFNIHMKSGEWRNFLITTRYPGADRVTLRRHVASLLELFQKFCSLDPPIGMYIYQKKELKTIVEAPGK